MTIESISSNYTLDGIVIFSEFCTKTERYLIGSRFQHLVKSKDAGMALDFFNNYACLVDYADMPDAWKCYKKAASQLSDDVQNAFWSYMEGKRIKFVGSKKSVIQWVDAA